jgi:hypothetical protein
MPPELIAVELRSWRIGGACGAALFGAILAHRLAAGHTAGAYQAVFAWTIPFTVLALISP